ncbi:hypothetical protein FACS1894219_00470 [Clostridia bacterium]|nr:hypothetical protein FACS1894219_00470 [Clostridia bacterium]
MAQMSSHERLINTIKGKAVDRLPWSPFLAYWWESKPEYHAMGQFKFMRELGCDPLLRGFCGHLSVERKNVEYTSKNEGNKSYTTISTPVGELHYTNTYVKEANTSFLTEHPLKTEEDVKILTYIMENTVYTPSYGGLDGLIAEVGDNGLAVPQLAAEGKTAFQSLVEFYAGTEELNYMLADYPETVEALLEVMWRNSKICADIGSQSNAEAFIFWEDSSSLNVSPPQFKKYVKDEINYWGKTLHDSGKLLLHHGCGLLRDLMPHLAELEIDMLESISPPPTGDIELWDAYNILKKDCPADRKPVGLIGGIEPVMLLTLPMDELRAYVITLIENMKRVGCDRFILANSDSCPVGVEKEKFNMVTEIVLNG